MAVEPRITVQLPDKIESGVLMAAFNDAMGHHHDDMHSLHGELHLLNHLLERLDLIEQGPPPVVRLWKRIWRRLRRG